ncbi:hypothetical protein BCIN_05g07930 [Botrytis cinerea B05.10]|uniref:BTB domain-containing protein n=2 Tax=Botryotinia fuckeliana TaxID=40559 RepID=A0A384JJ02_BOTFB|nr:hypothetical protein BCIN_05g07930 [Botrytis cinerea B05.10]ATZ50441.1 hypothetical protein BCIN_05g07930 [Botrytis cinerea B05.10]
MAESAPSDGGSQYQVQIKKFAFPGQLLDTRFRLFGKIEIHAHSSLLKMHSAFFRKFMDSPDKLPAKTGAALAYEWVDEVDDDGSGWHVVADSNKQGPSKSLQGRSEPEIDSFVAMLNCIYRIPFKVDPEQLVELTKLADYYRCLPAASNNLYACFYMSPNFDIHKAYDLIESAYKLRHPLLFRDCVIYIAGTMRQTPKFPLKNKDPNIQQALKQALMTVRNKIFENLLIAYESVHSTACQYDEPLFKAMKEASMNVLEKGKFFHPEFFRTLVDQEEEFLDDLETVLSGNLQLDSSAMAGIGRYDDHFFCASLSDEELPWDTTETDW